MKTTHLERDTVVMIQEAEWTLNDKTKRQSSRWRHIIIKFLETKKILKVARENEALHIDENWSYQTFLISKHGVRRSGTMFSKCWNKIILYPQTIIFNNKGESNSYERKNLKTVTRTTL